MAEIVRVERHASWTKGGPVVSHLPEDEIVALEERAQATIGDPATMGLWAFATGTWMAGTVIAGVFPQQATAAVVPVLIVFAGLAQFIAGLYAYRRANSLAATAFCCFGSFNVTAGVVFLMQALKFLPMGDYANVLLGFLLESFAFMALALGIAALRTNAGLVGVLMTLCVGYCLAGIPYLANAVGQPGWSIVGSIGGWFLVASALLAYWVGMTLVVNSTWKRRVLPIWGEP